VSDRGEDRALGGGEPGSDVELVPEGWPASKAENVAGGSLRVDVGGFVSAVGFASGGLATIDGGEGDFPENGSASDVATGEPTFVAVRFGWDAFASDAVGDGSLAGAVSSDRIEDKDLREAESPSDVELAPEGNPVLIASGCGENPPEVDLGLSESADTFGSVDPFEPLEPFEPLVPLVPLVPVKSLEPVDSFACAGDDAVLAVVGFGSDPLPATVPAPVPFGSDPVPATVLAPVPFGSDPVPATVPAPFGSDPVPATVPSAVPFGSDPVSVTVPFGSEPVPAVVVLGEDASELDAAACVSLGRAVSDWAGVSAMDIEVLASGFTVAVSVDVPRSGILRVGNIDSEVDVVACASKETPFAGASVGVPAIAAPARIARRKNSMMAFERRLQRNLQREDD